MKLKKATVNKLITYLMVIGMFTAIYILNEGGYLSRQLQKMLVPICINIILAISLNITVGFLGELTLGHAAFMSVGAYSGCLFSIAMKETLPMAARFPLAMLVGGLVAAVFGILVGIPVLRLRGDYLAIVTLAFGEIIRNVILNIDFFGGASGLKGTPRDSTFLIAAIVVLIICLCGGGKKNFRDMYADLARNNWCEIGKDGSGMSLDTNPDNEDDYFGVDSIEAMDAIEKVNRDLGFNDSVAQEMQQTRSIDGRQSASNDDYEITWSDHPDNGLEVLYKLK